MSKIQLKVDAGRELIIANFIRGMAMSEPSVRPIAVLSEIPIDPVSVSTRVVESTSDLINNLQRINYSTLDVDTVECEDTVDGIPLFLYKLEGETSLSFGSKMQEAGNDILCHLLQPMSLYVLMAFASGVRDADRNKAITELFIKNQDVPVNYVAFSSNHNEVETFKYHTDSGMITLDVSPLTECIQYTIKDLEKVQIVETVA